MREWPEVSPSGPGPALFPGVLVSVCRESISHLWSGTFNSHGQFINPVMFVGEFACRTMLDSR